MVTTYTVLLSIHVLAAVTWVGSNVAIHVLAVRARKAGPDRLMAMLDELHWYGNHVLAPTSLVLLLAGIGLVVDADLSFGDAWLSVGLAVWLLAFVNGAFYLGPQSGRVSKSFAAAGNTIDAATEAGVGRVMLAARVELTLLLIVVVTMVIKP